jgi:ATP synthase protein I
MSVDSLGGTLMSNSVVKTMLRKVTFYDFLVGYAITSILYFTYREYVWMFLIGLVISVINFIIGGIITEGVLLKNIAPGIFFILLKVLRIFLICTVPFIFYRYNMNWVIVYVLGFTSHFIALILYAVFSKNLD